MSESESIEMQPTSALPEHAWLKNLVGEWTTKGEFVMGPDMPVGHSEGKESVAMFGELWVLGEGESSMGDGHTMKTKMGLGYDVSFKEYRSFWVVTDSSHLWKSAGVLSEDGKVMTLTCEGPDMVEEGKTALYRDVIEIVNGNQRTHTSFGPGPDGDWVQFMKVVYTRVE